MGDLERELQQLHEAWLQVAAQLGSAPVLFSHPVYQYLERRYQLNGRSLHWEPDADPGESEWSSLAQLLESRPATLMVWEGEPLPETVRRLSALGITTVVVEPAADAGPGADFLKRQLANVARFKTALKPLQ
jgi:zinc transport system substrate-binding protein